MNNGLIAATLVAAFGCLTGAARAAEDADEEQEELDLVKLLNVEVSTATKTAESLEEAPAVITVVTKEDIRRWGYQSVAEVLEHTVGFYLIDDHILPNAGVRGVSGGLGAESGAIKVMIDGRSVAYRSTSGNWLGVELIPLGSIEQIEIVRGPASALYGADAFLGVVNIITLKPEDVRPVRARGTVGMMERNPSGRFDVVSGGTAGHFDWMLGAAGEYADRSGLTLPEESPAPTLPSYVGGRRTALNLERRSLVLQGRGGYRVAETGQLVLSLYASGIERGGDFAHWAQLTNQPAAVDGLDAGTVIALGQLRANLDALLHASRTFDLSAQATYFRGGILPADRIEIASELSYVERRHSYQGVDSALEARWTPSPRFTLITGVETLYDREELGAPLYINRITGEPVLPEAEVEAVDLTNVGAFVSANHKLFDPLLKLTGALRYDHHSVYGSQITGRVGTTSRFSPSLVAKLLYGSAFKAPSPYLLYATPLRPGDVVGNRELEAQRIQTAEYQMSWTPDRSFGLTSGVSYSWLFDKAQFTPQGINQTARNVASQRSLSWETRADLRHYEDYTAYASLELVHSERDLGQVGYAANLVGTRNVAYPPWIARGGVTFSLPSTPSVPLQLGTEGMWVGPRRAADASIVQRGEDFSLPPYFLLNVSLFTREVYLFPGHETRFALRSKNLLVARGPNPGVSGFEYPVGPSELFFELEHVY